MPHKDHAAQVRLLKEIIGYCQRLLAIDPNDKTSAAFLHAAQEDLARHEPNRTTNRKKKGTHQ